MLYCLIHLFLSRQPSKFVDVWKVVFMLSSLSASVFFCTLYFAFLLFFLYCSFHFLLVCTAKTAETHEHTYAHTQRETECMWKCERVCDGYLLLLFLSCLIFPFYTLTSTNNTQRVPCWVLQVAMWTLPSVHLVSWTLTYPQVRLAKGRKLVRRFRTRC